jgi:hypothetical protein
MSDNERPSYEIITSNPFEPVSDYKTLLRMQNVIRVCVTFVFRLPQTAKPLQVLFPSDMEVSQAIDKL